MSTAKRAMIEAMSSVCPECGQDAALTPWGRCLECEDSIQDELLEEALEEARLELRIEELAEDE